MMESDPRHAHIEKPLAEADPAFLLCQFVEQKADALINTMRIYLLKAGLASDEAIETLNEVMAEALDHADRFDTSRQPMAWLLGIAANLIKRKRAENIRRASREILMSDIRAGDDLSEMDLFDRLQQSLLDNPDCALEDREQAHRILSLVGEDDRRVLRCAILEDMNGEELARELGVTPGAARVRQCRALERLRAALRKEAGRSESNE
jgi:RNA polymerase sigma factor (sigma-70 family)